MNDQEREQVSIEFLAAMAKGRYKNKAPFPEKPEKPPVLYKCVGDLSTEEASELLAILTEYDRKMQEYKAALEAWGRETARLEDDFRLDLIKSRGLNPSDPFVREMYRLAEDSGHAHGFEEIVSEFDSLTPLYVVYERAMEKRYEWSGEKV